MKRGKQVLFGILAAACVVVILTFPVSPTTPGDVPLRDSDWIEEMYTPFDSLATDPDDYLWPTDASIRMSSGFAEYRRTHFHAGIDISTNGQRGYRVYASRDGYISRVYISPYGYGKMLHVTHSDGFITAYAHLQKFSDSIEEFARTVQYANEQYPIDTTLDTQLLPLRKGDVIAYTGDTGIGAPHLHFEVRDKMFNPINPLRFPGITDRIQDNIPPELQRIGFIPLNHRSRVNHDVRPWNGSVSRLSSNRYRSTKAIHLDGTIGMLIKGSDRVNSSYHRNGIYQLELYLNDSLIYRSRLDQISANESRQIALFYDWPSVLGGEGRFQKLFVEKGNRLPLYNRQPEGFGIIDTRTIAEGRHRLRVVATDIQGNRSELDVPVTCSRIPVIALRKDHDTLFVNTDTTDAIKTITVSTRRMSEAAWSNRIYTISDLQHTQGGYVLPMLSLANEDIKVVATNTHDVSSDPKFIMPLNSAGTRGALTIEKEIIRNYLAVRLSSPHPFTKHPVVSIEDDRQRHAVETFSVNDRIAVGTFPLSLLTGDDLRIFAEAQVSGTLTTTSDRLRLYQVTPAEGRTIALDDSTLVVMFAPETVYDTLYLQITRDEEGYSLLPKDVLLKNGVWVRHRIPENLRASHAGLFIRDDGERRLIGKWNPRDTTYLEGESTRLLGDLSVVEDTVPPSMSSLRVSATQSRLRFSFRISDDGAGVRPNGFRITAGGELFIAEYDPYKRLIHFEGMHGLPGGTHHLVIQAEDRLGNTTELTRSFSIPRR